MERSDREAHPQGETQVRPGEALHAGPAFAAASGAAALSRVSEIALHQAKGRAEG